MSSQDDVTEAVKRASVEVEGRNTLRCADALQIAEEMDVAVADIGRICNENKIKLVQCQLGCFK